MVVEHTFPMVASQKWGWGHDPKGLIMVYAYDNVKSSVWTTHNLFMTVQLDLCVQWVFMKSLLILFRFFSVHDTEIMTCSARGLDND